MTSFPDAGPIADALLYHDLPEVQGSPLNVVRAVLLEVKCGKCTSQDRWRGRSQAAVDKAAQRTGWRFDQYSALCPKHSDAKLRPLHIGKSGRIVKYPPPAQCFCGAPLAKRLRFGVGRPPTKCDVHVVRGTHISKKV